MTTRVKYWYDVSDISVIMHVDCTFVNKTHDIGKIYAQI